MAFAAGSDPAIHRQTITAALDAAKISCRTSVGSHAIVAALSWIDKGGEILSKSR